MILPGATLGVFGGGQLGSMFLTEARRMGYRVHILDPDPTAPAGVRADRHVEGRFDDAAAAMRLADGCDIVTLETEHIPAEVLAKVETKHRLRPGAEVLRNIQDRLAQRRFLARHGLPQPAFAAVEDLPSLKAALAEVGSPAVLKSRRGGYDGKGQARLGATSDAQAAWDAVGVPAVLEEFVPFDQEVSVVLARAEDGSVRAWPLAKNVHRDGILHTTQVPAGVPKKVEAEALRIATQAVDALGHVGVAAVELFMLGGQLLINEIAPRTHNSGHFTYGAAATSQFEQHVRAVCGLGLGDPTLLSPVVMVNLLGDLWADGEPDWAMLLGDGDVKLHLYGKKEARPGRKMGHFLVLADDPDTAMERALALYRRLQQR